MNYFLRWTAWCIPAVLLYSQNYASAGLLIGDSVDGSFTILHNGVNRFNPSAILTDPGEEFSGPIGVVNVEMFADLTATTLMIGIRNENPSNGGQLSVAGWQYEWNFSSLDTDNGSAIVGISFLDSQGFFPAVASFTSNSISVHLDPDALAVDPNSVSYTRYQILFSPAVEAVPEPASLTLVGLGFVGFLRLRRVLCHRLRCVPQ